MVFQIGDNPGQENKEQTEKRRSLQDKPVPGFEGIPPKEVLHFFIRGLQRGALTTRAASIAFQFFMATIPAMIFIISLIPLLPIEEPDKEIFSLLNEIMPAAALATIKGVFAEALNIPQGLRFFGIFLAITFSMNAMNAMIIAFNATYHTIETRSWIERRVVSLILVIILSFLLLLSTTLMGATKYMLHALSEYHMMRPELARVLINAGKWFFLTALIFSTISFFYYLAPSRKTRFKLISPGSLFATFLSVLASIIFTEFMDAFGRLDQIYGQLGSMMMVMLWMNFNALALLFGFELNASIKQAKAEKQEELFFQGNL